MVTAKTKIETKSIFNAAPTVKKAEKKKYWSFRNTADPNVGELTIYGPVSDLIWWGDEVTPSDFRKELDALGSVSEIKVFINSPGGDVFAGQAIYSMLKRHSATITVYVDGWAASIASVIAMAGDKIIMPKNAMMMIHKPWTFAMGNSTAFRKVADDLDHVESSIHVAYEDKSGIDHDKLVAMLEKETLLTAEEAVSLGFADEIEQAKLIAASVQEGHLILNGQGVDINGFKNVPNLLFSSSVDPTPAAPAEPTSAPEPAPQPEKTIPEEQQPQDGLLSLYQAKVQANKNRRF